MTIAKAIDKALENTDLHNSLSVIGSDGTQIIKGKHYANMATLEKLMQRPLQWATCLQHMNEPAF